MATFDVGISGLVGTVGLTVYKADGSVYAARSTASITELGSGTYWHQDPNPSLTLHLVWDTGVGTNTASETLFAGRGVDAGLAGVQRKYDGPWQKRGVFFPGFNVAETTVMPGGTDAYQAWYSQGPNLGYATAPSFFGPWTQHAGGTPIITAHNRSCVTLVNGTYHLYAAPTGDTQLDYYTSPDGFTWTLISSGALPLGTGSDWDATAIASSFLVQFGSTWYLFYEAYKVGYGYRIGVATASSPAGPWAKYAGSPVVGWSNGQAGRPCVRQVGADLYMWFHGNPGVQANGGLPTDLHRAHSTDMLNWDIDASPLLVRSTDDEGANRTCGQMADTQIYEVNGQLVLIYTGSKNGSNGTVDGIAPTSVGTKYATAPLPRTGTARIWNGTSWS